MYKTKLILLQIDANKKHITVKTLHLEETSEKIFFLLFDNNKTKILRGKVNTNWGFRDDFIQQTTVNYSVSYKLVICFQNKFQINTTFVIYSKWVFRDHTFWILNIGICTVLVRSRNIKKRFPYADS